MMIVDPCLFIASRSFKPYIKTHNEKSLYTTVTCHTQCVGICVRFHPQNDQMGPNILVNWGIATL